MKLLYSLYSALLLTWATPSLAQEVDELEYPREVRVGGNTLQIHHPVIDTWDRFKVVEGWIPIEVVLAGTDTRYVGAVRARANTQVDLARRLVTLSEQEILQVRFSNTDVPEEAEAMARNAIAERTHTVVLDGVLRALARDFTVPAQAKTPGILNHQPPRIVVTEQPTQLLLIDKQAVAAPITGTSLQFVVNTDWDLFHQPETGNWYVINQGTWQTQSMLATGGWNSTDQLPEDFRLLALGDEWKSVREALPPSIPVTEPLPFIVSLEPTELISIDGPAQLRPAGESGLRYVANTEGDLFEYEGRWFLLLAGRWFEAARLDGGWRPVERLPDAFASIPETHPRAMVRAAVPGTVESMVAMMEATLPRYTSVGPEAAAALQVMYVGEPRFEPIEGTSLARATNSPGYVFQHNNFYYLCHDAAWFLSTQPDGPWSVAHSVPDDVYRIPASDPAYFVTFVTPVKHASNSRDRAHFEFNSGYLGEFSTGVTVVHGTGWNYAPWLWYDPVGYPVYWSHPYTYGGHTGRYGPYDNRFYHYGNYWGPQSISLNHEPVGLGGSHDPAFQDPRLARRGYDYSTIEEQRTQEFGRPLNADDDYYTDPAGNVYRQSDGEWSQHTGSGWNTMAELERQYGENSRGSIGSVEAPQQQRQAYKQNPNDIERIKRWHESRRRSYNMYGYVSVYH